MVVPDLEYLAKEYLRDKSSHWFMEETCLGKIERPNVLRQWLGNSSHLWMWDFETLKDELIKVGFENVRRAQFGDSLPLFKDVEDEDRWKNCLGVECVKPSAQ